jgi:hypothetical protein
MKRAVVVLSLTVLGCGVSGRGVQARQSAEVQRTGVTETGEQTGVPRLVQFSGTLKDGAARPVSGVASVTFAIYAEQEGGAALWSETQNVLADGSGHYSVLLGAATAGGVPGELFGTGQSRWLGVTAARQPELPRVLLASVPYALKAGDADTLGGLPASAYVTTESLQALNARPATTVLPGATILASGAAAAQGVASASGISGDAASQSVSQSVTQATPTGSGTTDYIPLWTSASNLGNSILYQTNSRIGVGTTTPQVTLDVNGDSIFRGSFQLVPQGTATASTGQLSHSYQWEASTYNSSTKAPVTTAFGFRATPQGNNTANPTSSLDLYYGPGGGTLTDTGLSISNTGVITFAPNQPFSGTSVDFGYGASQQQGVIYANGNSLLSTYGSPASVFLGEYAGGGYAESSADVNVGVGFYALYALTSGNANTAIGAQALVSDTSGNDNTAVGYRSELNMQTGQDNVGIGAVALGNNAGGSYNTAVGDLSLSGSVVGSRNVAVGYSAGANNEGSYNTFLGYTADTPAQAINYATAIGYGAQVNQSNTLALGGVGPYAVNVGIGTPTPVSQLEISAPSGGSYLAPAPVLTVTGTTNGVVALDFNTAGISTAGTYNPSVRMAVLNETSGNVLAFYANKPGAGLNNGLQQTFALDAAGNAYVTGNLVKGGGSFKIDDPIDPANKYLSHSFVESPDMKNIYDGNVTTDAKGYATVTMPDWFEALNRDFRYQLTTINSFSRATVASELKNGKFRIRTTQPHVKVSWQVTGIRQDAWANAHRIPNEEQKPPSEQGHYLHPELFGAGPDQAIGASAALNAQGPPPPSGEPVSAASGGSPGSR